MSRVFSKGTLRRISRIEPKVSFVTVTWNCADELSVLLESLNAKLPIAFEVIVVDNGSADEVDSVAGRFDSCRLIKLDENLGFGGGNNLGVAEAKSEVCVLINPDTYLVDNSIAELIDIARDERAIFGPRILNVDLTDQPSASAAAGDWLTSLGLLVPPRLFPGRIRLKLEPWKFAGRHSVGWLTGVCLVARTDLLRELGPFDERIHMYSEDLELGLRAASLGVESVFDPDAGRIVHIGDASSSKRYSDAGKRLSLSNRFGAVESIRGSLRAWADFLAFTVGTGIRVALKTLLRHDAEKDREWLKAAISVRSSAARRAVI